MVPFQLGIHSQRILVEVPHTTIIIIIIIIIIKYIRLAS